MKELSDLISKMFEAKWVVMLAVATLPIAAYVWLHLIYKFFGFLFE